MSLKQAAKARRRAAAKAALRLPKLEQRRPIAGTGKNNKGKSGKKGPKKT